MDSLSQVAKFENDTTHTYPSSRSSGYSGSTSTDSDGGYKLASRNPKNRTGRRKFKETRHPVFRGIRRRNGDKWVCELRNNKSRLWLGTYPTAEMVARAHDVAAMALRGKSACLNFADSVWRLPVPDSSTDCDIKKAAVEAAESFRARESGEKGDCFDAESSSSSSSKADDEREEGSEENVSDEQSGVYMDEEATLFMPQLLVDMADGLLLPPPTIFYDETRNLCFDCDGEIALWNY